MCRYFNEDAQVEVTDIVDRHLISRMRDGIAGLQSTVDEWIAAGAIQEVDWSRMRVLEFQEIFRSRDSLFKILISTVCQNCPEFLDHVSWTYFLLLVCI